MRKVFVALTTTLVLVACSRSNSGGSGGPHPAPIVTTDPVTGITTTSAVSGGLVTGNDSTALTARGIQWATDSIFTNPQTANANSAVNFSATMSGLSPATSYYVRAFATNVGGTGYGAAIEFTTNATFSDYTVSTYATFPDSIDLPMGVAVGAGGLLYACGNGGQVWTIAPNGSVALLADPGLELRDIVADAKGNCYALTQLNDIRRITPGGVVSVFATGFSDLQVADIDSSGNIYVGDLSSVRKIDTAGHVTTLYTLTTSNEDLSGIAIDKAHNNIYFATPDAVYRVDSLGNNFTYIAGKNGSADGTGIGAGFSGVFELRMNKDGNLVAADENKIRLITPAGVVTTMAGTAAIGFQDGDGNIAAFRFAVGLAIDANGVIYVADDANARIRKIVHK